MDVRGGFGTLPGSGPRPPLSVPTPEFPAWLLGLDVGQVHDPAALVITEITRKETPYETCMHYQGRHIERFPLGLPYPQMVQAVIQYIDRLPIPKGFRQAGTTVTTAQSFQHQLHWRLLIDATGVGRPIVDMFRAEHLAPIAVTLTHGEKVTQHHWNEITLSKRVLIGAFQVVLQTSRFKVPDERTMPIARVLVQEALNFQYKITESGNDQYGAWREGQHDDVLFAAALTAWYGERQWPPQFHQGTPRQTHAVGGGLKWR